MTDAEKQVLSLLAQAWNQFVLLPVLHEWEREEFMQTVHMLQNMVLARAGLRALETGIEKGEREG